MDEEELRKGDLPPTFYCYGTEDPFYGQFEEQYELMQDMGPKSAGSFLKTGLTVSEETAAG